MFIGKMDAYKETICFGQNSLKETAQIFSLDSLKSSLAQKSFCFKSAEYLILLFNVLSTCMGDTLSHKEDVTIFFFPFSRFVVLSNRFSLNSLLTNSSYSTDHFFFSTDWLKLLRTIKYCCTFQAAAGRVICLFLIVWTIPVVF